MEGCRLELGVEQLAGYFRDFLTFPGSQKLSARSKFGLCVCVCVFCECQIGIFPRMCMFASRLRSIALKKGGSVNLFPLFGQNGVYLSPLDK